MPLPRPLLAALLVGACASPPQLPPGPEGLSPAPLVPLAPILAQAKPHQGQDAGAAARDLAARAAALRARAEALRATPLVPAPVKRRMARVARRAASG